VCMCMCEHVEGGAVCLGGVEHLLALSSPHVVSVCECVRMGEGRPDAGDHNENATETRAHELGHLGGESLKQQ